MPQKLAKNPPPRDALGRLLPGGGSLNPSGRPRGTNLGTAIRRMLSEVDPDDEHRTRRERVAAALFRLADEGNVVALKELLRVDVFDDHEDRLERLEESLR